MTLYSHQQQIIDADPKRTGIFLGTGTGKTKLCLALAEGTTLVICPKTQKLDRNWERENETQGKSVTVMSKEEFKKHADTLARFDTVIVDEAHVVAGATPNTRRRKGQTVPKCSQIFEKLLEYLRKREPNRIYLATATPARNPMAVWALAKLLGGDPDFFSFRDTFYVKLPMPGREAYAPRKDAATKARLAQYVNKLGYTGRLQDFFDVPAETHLTEHCPLTSEQKTTIENLPLEYPDPLVLIQKTHQVEQGFLIGDDREITHYKSEKLQKLDDLAEEYDKLLIFARYTEQIRLLEKRLKKKMPTVTLTGATTDRRAAIQKAEDSERCAVIAQSSVSTGYELPSFNVCVFASCSYSYVDLTQAQGRIQRANNIGKKLYIYLQSGEVDRAVLQCMQSHSDFSEKMYAEGKSYYHQNK